jgi:predicted alpha/beta superfamily hydrolase
LRFPLLSTLAVLLLTTGVGRAQTPQPLSVESIEIGLAHTFDSATLGEARTLNILLPPGYSASTESFPVIYLLDGAIDEDYHHVSGLVQFMTTYELMPPSILVGIANGDRMRDMTFPTTIADHREQAPTQGGSEAFRAFLHDEVVGYVDANFRANGHSTLIGQSLAGLLATEVFVESPELFDDYIIVSPSLWWSDASLVPRIAESLIAHPDKRGTVCLAVGTEGKEMEGPVHEFAGALAKHAPEGLKWKHLPLPAENHATVLHRALYRAFEELYGEEYPGL